MRALTLPLLFYAGPAMAHGAAPGWNADAVVVLPLLFCLVAYLAGLLRLWRRAGPAHGISGWHAASYLLGWGILAAALLSPLHVLGEQLFTAHMLEHELVMAVAAPLLVLGRPIAALLWALPHGARHRLVSPLRAPWWRRCWRVLMQPVVATTLHGAAIWLWHVPGLFEAAIASPALHRLQHLSFLLTGLQFWWALLRRRQPLLAVAHLFITMMHTGLLGALLVFAPQVFYAHQTAGAVLWGFTALEDQQLAGLVMWVAAGVVYALAAVGALGHGLQRGREGGRHALAHP